MKLFKRALTIILMLAIVYTFIGCQQTESPVDEKNLNENTQASGSELPKDDKEDDSSKESESEPQEQPKKEDFVGHPSAGLMVSHCFYSVEDLETYIRTGSHNLSDYKAFDNVSKFPSVTFEYYLDSETLANSYISLAQLFNANETSLDAIGEVRFIPVADGAKIWYWSGKHEIVVTHSPKFYNETISSNPIDRIELDRSAKVIDQFSEKEKYSDCYITRKIGNTNLLYEVDKGSLSYVTVIMGGYCIQIISTHIGTSLTASEKAELQNSFMTSEATAPFAALFSEDDAVVEQALNRIASAIEAKEASIKASAN